MARKVTALEFNIDKATTEELAAEYDKQLRAALREQLGQIGAEVHGVIEKATNEIICNALGIKRSSYGDRWEVDHCNGRRTAVAEELGQVAMSEVKAAMPDFAKEIARKMPKKIEKALEQEYAEIYGRRIREAIRELAESDAKRDAAKAVAGLKQMTKVAHDPSRA